MIAYTSNVYAYHLNLLFRQHHYCPLIFIFDFAPEGIEICLSIVQPSILVLSHGQEENPEDNVLPAQSV